MAKRLLSGVIATLIIEGMAVAGPFEDGIDAYSRNDYAAAARPLHLAAEQGNAAAQSVLGSMYAEGTGIRQDHAEAVRWWRRAADQGLADAQFLLGLMYANGQGVRKDYAEAVLWYRKAADQRNVAAQYNLGLMYEYGAGVSQNDVVAHMWFNLAAEQGDALARSSGDDVARRMTAEQIAKAQRLAREWQPK